MTVKRGMPLDVEFLGWRSNTSALQYHGWEIAETKTEYGGGKREHWGIAIRHPRQGISGMSKSMQFHKQYNIRREGGPGITLHMEIGLPYMIQEREHTHYCPVNTEPRMIEVRSPVDLYYMPYFQPLDEGKDIFLKRASVDEIMQIALDKQQPRQAEMRARRMQEQKRTEYRDVKARIILAT